MPTFLRLRTRSFLRLFVCLDMWTTFSEGLLAADLSTGVSLSCGRVDNPDMLTSTNVSWLWFSFVIHAIDDWPQLLRDIVALLRSSALSCPEGSPPTTF